MINSVTGINSYQNNVFRDFKQPNYYMNTPYAAEAKEKKSHKLGVTLAASAMVIGFGALALLSGGANKGLGKILNKWKSALEKRIAKGSKFEDLFTFLLNRVKSFQAKTESINNFTTLKDVLFQRLMWGKNGDRKFLRRIHEGITNFFDKISRKTVNSYYNKANSKFSELSDQFTLINERIRQEHPNDSDITRILDEISRRMNNVNQNLETGFGLNARNERYIQIQRGCDGLFDFFWNASISDIRNFKSRNMYNSFIAEDYLIPTKLTLSNRTSALRQKFTHDINDTYKATMKAISNIQEFVDPADTATNDVLRTLRKNLERYKKLSGKNEATERDILTREIISNLNELSGKFTGSASKYNYSDDAVRSISVYIQEVNQVLRNTEKGELQEILTLYKKILPRNEYLKLRAQAESAVKSLDKAIDIETNQYVDKARDLKLGSAPTDVLSILGTVGTVGYFLNKSKDKDEKYSVAIKYGIPAIGAIATSLYCTARLVAGGKALLFGLVSGWLMNKAGEAVDNARKKYTLDVSFHNKTLVKTQPDKV